MPITTYIQLMRPHQHVKNLFIFAPLFFGLRITDVALLSKTCFAFFAFSLVASAVYIFNDYHDAEDDRRHPKKKNRPLASGSISKKGAIYFMAVLLMGGLGLSYLLSHALIRITLFYVALNIAYTVKLKHVAIIDLFIIAIGFVIRLFIGSAVTQIALSEWIILMTFLLALFLAIAKRRDDVIIFLSSGEKMRKVIDGYNLDILNLSMSIVASITIVSYIMYTISPEIIAKAHSDKLYYSVIFVMLGMMRYMQISFVEGGSGSPTEVLLRDRFVQLTIVGWLALLSVLLY